MNYFIDEAEVPKLRLSLLTHQHMPKPIPHCSNLEKIVFLG